MLANVCGYSGADFGKGCDVGVGSAWLTVDYIYVVAIGKYTSDCVCIKSDLEMQRESVSLIQFRLALARYFHFFAA